MTQLNAAMAAFYSATVELSLAPQVTTFTLSDFSRTCQPGSNGGSDHGWGSNHIIMGGAVCGRRRLRPVPALALGGPSIDAGSNGRWIPTTSVDQYGSTLTDHVVRSRAGQLAVNFPKYRKLHSADASSFLG